jgi:molecular chaperone IbpA
MRAPKTGPSNRPCHRRFRDDEAMIANSCSKEDTMRHVDFSPLYRSTVGFDRLFTMLDSLGQPDQSQTYPPYNIERTGENA